MGGPSRLSPKVRERATRLVMEERQAQPSQWAAQQAVATKLGTTAEPFGKWVRQAERDAGQRPGARPVSAISKRSRAGAVSSAIKSTSRRTMRASVTASAANR